MGFKDNINPALLYNATTDLSSYEPDSPSQTPEETGEDDSASPMDATLATIGSQKAPVHKVARKKRKHAETAFHDINVVEFLREKWERDQEKNDADLALKKQFMEDIKRDSQDFLTCFKGIAETMSKIADD